MLRAILVFLNKKIVYELKTTSQIFMQFYTVMYLTWFCKWIKGGGATETARHE